jgi:serine/threonine-protein kinase
LFIDRFIREAKASARLSHPHVVGVFDQGTHGDLAYLVMEQVAGRTLREILAERGRLSIPEAATVMSAILDGLAAAHRTGLVHRDVKPENVLIGVDGSVKVADFGLARAVESVTATQTGSTVLGTVAYVSPEQIVTGGADTRSDVYSAGITFFEMLTGSVPFGGESSVNVAFQHVNNDVPPASTRAPVPPTLDALVLRATRREPGARPLDAGAFLAELRHVATDLGLPHAPVAAPAGPPPADPPTVVQPVVGPGQGMGPRHSHATRVVPMGPPPGYGPPPAPVGPSRRPRSGLIAIAILVALGLVAAGTGWYLGAGRYTTAPSVLKLSQRAAAAKASQSGLSLRIAPGRYSETVSKGLVVVQDPGPAGRVVNGGQITVVFSLGPERFRVPDVIGLNQDDAQKALAALNLRTTVTPQFSNDAPNGTVISSNPAKDTSLARDSVVTLVVSRGAKPVDLPDLRGRLQAEAEQLLRDLGLNPDIQLRDSGDGDQSGRVLDQDPGQGSVTSGSVVHLTVGAGQAQVEVPDVLGLNRQEAEQRLGAQGLQLRRIGGNGKAFLELPTSSSKVDAGSRVTVWFAP